MMNDPIAIVGAACQYPDASSPAELWENILSGRRAFRRLPDCRLRLDDYLGPADDPNRPDTTYAAKAALITNYEFDRARFRVVGSTFRSADMAHWLALDVASRALADAGFPDGEGLPKEQVGVLIGNSLTGEFSRAGVMRLRWPYVRRTVDAALAERDWSPEDRAAFLSVLEAQYKAPFAPPGDETLAGGLSNTIAGRISNYFDLRGGGYTVDGACASSLLAVANACSSLTAGDIDIALAGGVDLSLDPFELVGFARVGALAKGEMRVYDARSAGFLPGEGCGIVVLMRYNDALAQGRRIYALVRGWGISSDGSGGITRPEVKGQKLALQRAYRRAGFGADTVGYFEGHGTGTTLGDATELETIEAVRHEATSAGRESRAAIGSIKAQIGHTKAAAGIAGLLKAAFALHHEMLPPSIGWDQPHPLLTGAEASLKLLRRARPWPAELPRRAAVSAMGFGGINAHVVLEAAEPGCHRAAGPHVERLTSSIQDGELFLFAGDDAGALERQVRRVASYAARLSYAELSDLAAELERSLSSGTIRAAVVASRPDDLQQSLDALLEWLASGADMRLAVDRGVFLATADAPPSVGYLFPGQGTAASLRGGAWANRFPFIRMRYEQANLPVAADAVATEVAHPAIITASLAGLDALQHFGIEAAVGIGHSLGELAAYHWAGVFDEPALMRVAVARGRAIAEQGQPGGAMAGIAAPADVVARLIAESPVVISGLNAPTQTIVSGPAAAVEEVVARAHAGGLQAVRLSVSHAFHSPLVAGAVDALSPALQREEFRPPNRLTASTITGGFLDGGEDLRELLRRQLTSPVRLIDAVQAAEMKVDLWIEVGPGHVLGGILGKWANAPVVSLDAGGDSLNGLLRSIAAAFVLGAPIRTSSLFEDRFTRPFDLDWNPTFFVNPCELAPLPDAELKFGHHVARDLAADEPSVPQPLASSSQSPLDVVRQLVADRAELPLAAVQASDQLLQDLHFSSIAVGGVVADAARALGLPPPVSPTDYARATVGEVAAALDELARTGIADAPASEVAPPGVDSWVRNFTVELVEQPLPARRATAEPGDWRVVAPADHEFAAHLPNALNENVAGRGVALCMPPDADERHLPLLIEATRLVLENPADCRFVVVQHAAVAGGWARTLHVEMPQVATCVVNVPAGDPRAVDRIIAEAGAAEAYVEAHYDTMGIRRVPVLRLLAEHSAVAPPPAGRGGVVVEQPLGPQDVLLVTGGGKGIAAECALSLAKRYGVRLALLGRSRPGETGSNGETASAGEPASAGGPSTQDPTLDENLARFTAAGIEFRYLSADVTDADAVQAAVEEIRRSLGPVTAVLHGAGGNVPQSLRTVDEAAVRATLAPKVDGLRHVLAAVDPDRLRLLVTFGSIIARTGLHGEADYALANEWLTRDTEQWQAAQPHCRCLAVEWSVWSGVGMGERLGRIEALRHQGITPIGPDEGVRILRQLIAAPPARTAVVVSGRFGKPPTLRMEQPELPLVRFLEQPRLHVPGVELISDVTLSLGADPYLRDHAYKDTPLLPAVMGLEAMAQLSMTLTGSARPPEFENVELSRPVTVPADGSRTIRFAALLRAPGECEVVLRSDETGFQADHFRAVCRFKAADFGLRISDCGLRTSSDNPQSAIRNPQFSTDTNGSARLSLDPLRDLYGSILFHRGRFQRIEGYRQLSATRCLAEVSPDGHARWFGGYLPEKMYLGDPAMRDAAIHAIQACIPHGTILPVGIDRIVFGDAPLTEPCFVRAHERDHHGDRFVYDLEIVSQNGRVCERWHGLHLQRVDQAAPAATWAGPLLAPYLERRLAELVPDAAATVALLLDGQSGDEAMAAVLGGPVTHVPRRADGKPTAVCDRAVSVAHAERLTLSIAGSRGFVACDAEPVVHREPREWADLLGAERGALARLVAEQIPADDFDAAATRLWAAAECLKKAGLPLDTPLLLEDTTPDRWVLLKAGAVTIATWVGDVREAAAPLAVALLLGRADEVL